MTINLLSLVSPANWGREYTVKFKYTQIQIPVIAVPAEAGQDVGCMEKSNSALTNLTELT